MEKKKRIFTWNLRNILKTVKTYIYMRLQRRREKKTKENVKAHFFFSANVIIISNFLFSYLELLYEQNEKDLTANTAMK